MSKRVAKPRITPYVPYSERRNERCWRWSGNRQTDTHMHARTQDKYRNPSAHARKKTFLIIFVYYPMKLNDEV